MNRVQLIVILGFAVAFLAGGSVGMLASSGRPEQATPRHGPRHPLTAELGLSPAQQEQMRRIWSEAMAGEGMRQLHQRRMQLHRQRTEAFEALLTDEQRKQYEQILADCDSRMRQANEQRERLIQAAVERTRAILTESQATKYDEMRKARSQRRGRGGHRRGPFGRDWRGGPGTRPAHRGRSGGQREDLGRPDGPTPPGRSGGSGNDVQR